MKKKILTLLVFAALIALPACEETTKDAAQKASKEMCDCIKDHSLSYCEDRINSNYSSYTGYDEFYTEFNKVNDCGITISKKTK